MLAMGGAPSRNIYSYATYTTKEEDLLGTLNGFWLPVGENSLRPGTLGLYLAQHCDRMRMSQSHIKNARDGSDLIASAMGKKKKKRQKRKPEFTQPPRLYR